MYPPPPPYALPDPVSPPPFPSHNRPPPTLVTLPPHLLLRIVYETFPPGTLKNQRKVLYWLTMSLRLVNRALYVACMHVLRSTYLPAYASLIRPPYTSDPFPLSLPDSPFAAYASSSSPLSSPLLPLQSMQRETRVLDLYIALKVREDVWADESELHLEREESFKDLFDLMQPRARLEDLVRAYGRRDGVVSVLSSSGTTPLVSSPCPPKKCASGVGSSAGKSRVVTRTTNQALPFHALSVSYSPRAVGIVLLTKERKKTIVQVPRTREETLEDSARKLVRELRGWIAANPNHGIR
ncbi:uncharacterized protein TRAVEDRAFT_38602 [Trametes versicolor FP-101664 SS1]|uniref:uncharacterized protein n=1 Tax=Trametes versicolor (strain FP-101664) TaxID=717944 RepID=UPI0004622B43|nr:uncharacterized protein TRAVEDRAFT_38602 [Trametes versicolor FP-101664 SS1]EIW56818.1 hypothetical protein TRAVEDRAFT_38602 [Trametes versicolor FP-101664 SS1]